MAELTGVEKVERAFAGRTDDTFVCDLVDGPFRIDGEFMVVGDIRAAVRALSAERDARAWEHDMARIAYAAICAERDRLRAALERISNANHSNEAINIAVKALRGGPDAK